MNSAITISALFFGLFGLSETEPVELIITTKAGTIIYSVEIADNAFTQLRGLMNRQTVPANTGMLFAYDKDKIAHFWMKNVTVSLDILFLNRCGEIVEIYRNAKPDDPTVITSMNPVRGVLEIPGGASNRAQMRKGDRVQFSASRKGNVFEHCINQ